MTDGQIVVSTHAPHAGRAPLMIFSVMSRSVSTHAPHAGRAFAAVKDKDLGPVSTHAPHAGRAAICSSLSTRMICFNSRAPRGARHVDQRPSLPGIQFQLTRPTRGAPGVKSIKASALSVSTHAPHAGRAEFFLADCDQVAVSTHAPHAGRARLQCRVWRRCDVSTHAPHAGRAFVWIWSFSA